MIKIQTLEVSGFKGAIYGMRNPLKSRDLSDSEFTDVSVIGPKDMALGQRLLSTCKDDESKFMRMIHVQADITAPLYWWKEFDTYKIATVANSESTMHTIAQREFTASDFSFEQLYSAEDSLMSDLIDALDECRDRYLESTDKLEKNQATIHKNWYQLIQLLPSAYMQKRTVDLDYQTLRRIFFARQHHKLYEWSGKDGFCEWVKTLPYAEDLITYDRKAVLKTQAEAAKDKWSRTLGDLLATMLLKRASIDEVAKVTNFSIYILNSSHSYPEVIKRKAEELNIQGLIDKYAIN